MTRAKITKIYPDDLDLLKLSSKWHAVYSVGLNAWWNVVPIVLELSGLTVKILKTKIRVRSQLMTCMTANFVDKFGGDV